MFNFERLEVWKKSVTFAGTIYRATKAFPENKRFGLTNQLRRAAVSIASNIAEGSARSPADYAKFLSYASGSVAEVVTQTRIALNESLLPEETYKHVYAKDEEISRMLSGLRKSLDE